MSPVILKPPQLLMYRQQCGADLTAGVCLGCGWEWTQIHPGNVAGSVSGWGCDSSQGQLRMWRESQIF